MCDTEKLILCIENYPCIWDTSIEDYHDREKKDLAWLNIFKRVIENYETLSEEKKKLKGLVVKRKWSNCRDYYRKDRKKLKSCSTRSVAKKGKRYVFADILKFLDKTVTRTNDEGKDDEVNDSEVSWPDGDTEISEIMENEEKVRLQDEHKKKIKDESKKTNQKVQDMPEEILNTLNHCNCTNRDYDDDEKYLLSFSGDIKKMTHLQKIEFKLGMMRLLKQTF